MSNGAFGISALGAHVERDPVYLVPRTRQAYGVSGRYAPVEAIVVYGEGDLLVENRDGESFTGNTGFIAVDGEIIQGVHLKGTGEWLNYDIDTEPDEIGGWLTAQWFLAPHMDIRVDVIERKFTGATVWSTMGLGQFHFYL
jgi:hypothetical protein